jgi:hypothetical protein
MSAAVQAYGQDGVGAEIIDLTEEFGREQATNAPDGGRATMEFGGNADKEPEFFNDAEMLGSPSVEFDDFLNREATFLTGEMWGTRDKRNTQDEAWKPVTMPWSNWIIGGAGDKDTPAWGFSRHPVAKQKEGPCIVLGSSIGGARKAKAMDTMYAMGLDIDSGAKLDDVLDTVERKGLLVLVSTTFNHGRCGLKLKRDEVLRKLGIKTDPTLEQVQDYLRTHDKNRYEESFIAGITIRSAKKQVKEGVVVELDTPPLEKFRLIFPLATPVKIIDLAETHDAALSVWEDKITGLARNVLGVHFDTSCTDASRLFYTPRHAKDANDWYAAIVQGKPLDFATITPMRKASYMGSRTAAADNPFSMAGRNDANGIPDAFTPKGESLNDWHSTYKDRFLIANLLEAYCPDRIRIAGGEGEGQVHTECPFEGQHTSEGGTGTMAINCVNGEHDYWTWFCLHDGCRGKHKLQFLEEALRAGWFDESLLFDPDSGYMLEGEEYDSVIEDAPTDRTARHADASSKVRDDLLAMVKDFNADTTEPDVRAVIRAAIEAKADTAAQGRLKAAITARTPIKASGYNGLWKDESSKARKKSRPKASTDTDMEACHIKSDYPDQLEYARRRIREENDGEPCLFQFGGAYATADAVRNRVRMVEGRDNMFSVIEKVTRWEADIQLGGEWVSRMVPPPEAVVRSLSMDNDFADTMPEILGVLSTPFFDRDGNLVETDGYHPGARVVLAKGDLVVPGVSRTPTAEEVTKAKRVLVEEVLADYPIAGMTRKEIVATLSGEDSRAHAVTHTVATMLLPFCRDMIDGPTPGHVFTKPHAGTGASKLVDMLTTIAIGSPVPAMAFPQRKEEAEKTLSSALAKGAPVILFDNIDKAMDSGALASAMTAHTYQARILGKSEVVTVPVRAVWVFTAKDIEASNEILRRFVIVPLDRDVPDPMLFVPKGGWHHADLMGWVRDNRPTLVWACLTLIQHWVAGGMVKQPERPLASYEDWAGVMGGILARAGFHGFLDGQKEERAKAADSTQDGLTQLLNVLADYPSGTVFRPGGNRLYNEKPTFSMSISTQY